MKCSHLISTEFETFLERQCIILLISSLSTCILTISKNSKMDLDFILQKTWSRVMSKILISELFFDLLIENRIFCFCCFSEQPLNLSVLFFLFIKKKKGPKY